MSNVRVISIDPAKQTLGALHPEITERLMREASQALLIAPAHSASVLKSVFSKFVGLFISRKTLRKRALKRRQKLAADRLSYKAYRASI